MKRLAVVFLLTATCLPAMAQESPKTIELPTDLVVSIQQYLVGRPYSEVANYIGLLNACASVQVPQNGTIKDTGQCPAVSMAVRARADVAAQIATLTKERDELKAKGTK